MATLVLSAVGAALGGTFGGTVLGITGAALGKAAGGVLGSMIDQKLLGDGSEPVEMGRLESLKLQSSGEGGPIPHVFGGMRVAGQIIWASNFTENVTTESQGGKGGPPKVTSSRYSYSVNMAIALGEGEISRIGKIWIDGQEISQKDLELTLYSGSITQLPDPVIVANDGIENTCAYRGTAYAVIENLNITEYGNRIPQFNFEVFRPAQPSHFTKTRVESQIRGVCLIPGTGEYSLATTPVHFEGDFADSKTANMNSLRGKADVNLSLSDLSADLLNVGAVSLVVSWFGNDLRCGDCEIAPCIEQQDQDGETMPWIVSGSSRDTARIVSKIDGRPVFGGTPCDQSVVEAIAAIRNQGQSVTFYPFILMDIQADNNLPNPWTGEIGQNVMPWRGRITTSLAPNQIGTPDQTVSAADEVSNFFGTCGVDDFTILGEQVHYSGVANWSYRRFILHYAYLCKLAGGVETFCIGSELRSLTQIRSTETIFPAVEQLKTLAQDVKNILGENCKVGYAADWSEYFGYHPQDGSGDVYFHLDPLWSDPSIDFIGIDNYMPLSDWRDNEHHLDIHHKSIYNLEYLLSNVMAGEGYDWYYADAMDREAQIRTPIVDGSYDEHWVYRYKDIKNWWSKQHYNRIAGIRDITATDWIAQSKPIFFTEFGCPAIDKGTNQPNVFVDPKSSESKVPYFSSGAHDPLIQKRYLEAVCEYWRRKENNPISVIYDEPMLDLQHCYAWAWDARPWPEFPGRKDLWSDGDNYPLGHWLSGRFTAQELNFVVAEICELSGYNNYDVSELRGFVKGTVLQTAQTARSLLQALMIAHDFGSHEDHGVLIFRHNQEFDRHQVIFDDTVEGKEPVTKSRGALQDLPERLKISFWDYEGGYQTGVSEIGEGQSDDNTTSGIDIPLVLTSNEVGQIGERILYSSRSAQEDIKITLPPSACDIKMSDLIEINDQSACRLYRVQKINEMDVREVDAVRVRPEYIKKEQTFAVPDVVGPQNFLPVEFEILDIPNIVQTKLENPLIIAATAKPWPGSVAVYSSSDEDGFEYLGAINTRSIIGNSLNDLPRAFSGRWARGSLLHIKISDGVLQSRTEAEIFSGKNALAIRNSRQDEWEILQYQFADPQQDGSYKLSGLLRGQAGTDALSPTLWPTGSRIVILDNTAQIFDVPIDDIGRQMNYRLGPTATAPSDKSFRERTFQYNAVHNRPYSPVQLRQTTTETGDSKVSWVRRTRRGGDVWDVWETPLQENIEQYHIRLKNNSEIVWEDVVSKSNWTFTQTLKTQLTFTNSIYFEVAQISETFGVGPYAGVSINA